MSESSIKGQALELKVAKILRSKLGARVQRDSRSGAGLHKADIRDYYRDTPLHLELKNQETIKVKEWFRQADDSSSFNQVPTLVFQMDEEILATLRFSDLVNFMVEIADQKAEIDDLRTPVKPDNFFPVMPTKKRIKKYVNGDDLAKDMAREEEHNTCRNGHLADVFFRCNQKGCPFGHGYKKPKAKKVKR